MDYLALFLSASLFGGIVIYSFGFAPLVFSTLSEDLAGDLLRKAFPWYYLYIIVFAFLAGAALVISDRLSAFLMIAAGILGIVSRQYLMPEINRARDDQLRGSSHGRSRFRNLHGFSVLINFVQLGMVGIVLARFL